MNMKSMIYIALGVWALLIATLFVPAKAQAAAIGFQPSHPIHMTYHGILGFIVAKRAEGTPQERLEKACLFAGTGAGTVVEAVQHFSDKSPFSAGNVVSDIIADTIGACIGAYVAIYGEEFDTYMKDPTNVGLKWDFSPETPSQQEVYNAIQKENSL